MVNIPSNLQKVWDDVSKDGKIDRADAEKLLKEAAPSLAASGTKDLDKVNSEIDSDESAFLANFSNIKEGSSVAVKNGTAKGTFEFVDAPTTATQPEATTTKTDPVKTDNAASTSATTKPNQYFKPLSLNGTEQTQPVQPNPAETKTAPTATTEPAANASDTEKLSYYKDLKQTLPQVVKDPAELAKQIAIVDTKIKTLEDKIKANPPAETKPADGQAQTTGDKPVDATSKTETNTPAVEPKKAEPSLVAQDLERIKQLNELKEESSKDPKLADQLPAIDKKIQDTQAKLGPDFITEAGKIGSESSHDEFMQAKENLKKDYESLPDAVKNSPEVKQAYEAGLAKTYTGAKAALFKEINTVIDSATKEVLKTGDMGKFTEAKAKVEELLGKYKDLENDPDFKKIKGILSGDVPIDDVRKKAYNSVHAAIDLATGVNTLIDKPKWNSSDTQKAIDFDKQLPEGPLKTKLEDRIKGGPSSGGKDNKVSTERSTTDKAIDDVMGKGFFNATNKEGTSAIFQTIASRGDLDETVKKMNADDQKRLMKLLAESNDQYSLSIARRVYDNISKSANVDDDLDRKTLQKIKNVNPDNFDKGKINEDLFAKGLKYSVYSEKEAALTMARGILDNTVPSGVLSKLDDREVSMLIDVVGKQGSKEEKDKLLQMISGNYAKGGPVNVEFLNKDTRGAIVKNVLNDPNVDESKLNNLLEKAGKDAVLKMVKTENLDDKQLVMLAKHSNGDKMSDDTDVSSKMLAAMIRTYNKEPNGSTVTLQNIKKFIEEIGHDRDKDEVMKKLIEQLGDGPDSEYVKFNTLAPATMGSIWNMTR